MVHRLFLSGDGCFRSSREPVLRPTFPRVACPLTAGSAASGALGDFCQSAAVAAWVAAAAAAAGLPRGRNAELPSPGGGERGRQSHPAFPADRGGSQVSFRGRGGRRGPEQGPQPGPLVASSRPSQGPQGRSKHSGGFCVPQGWRPSPGGRRDDGPLGLAGLWQSQFCLHSPVLLAPHILSVSPLPPASASSSPDIVPKTSREPQACQGPEFGQFPLDLSGRRRLSRTP